MIFQNCFLCKKELPINNRGDLCWSCYDFLKYKYHDKIKKHITLLRELFAELDKIQLNARRYKK